MKWNKKFILGAMTIALISGCASKPKVEEEDFSKKKYVIEEPKEKEIHDAIVKAASNVEKAIQTLADVNNAEKSEVLSYDKIRQARWRKTYTPIGMERTMTISNWDGPVKPVFSQIQKLTGYEIRFKTPEPSTGTFVSLNFQDEKIINVIRSIEAQLQTQINIEILEDDKLIEVSYVK
jgi:hypothetical protein